MKVDPVVHCSSLTVLVILLSHSEQVYPMEFCSCRYPILYVCKPMLLNPPMVALEARGETRGA